MDVMPDPPDASVREWIESVVALVPARLPAAQVADASEFVRRYFRDADPEDLRGRDVPDLYGAAVSHWQLARRRPPGGTALRIYNPTVDEHGWQCPHTVVELVQRDMPFLLDSVRMQINALGFISHLVIHPVMPVVRDADGHLVAVLPTDEHNSDARAESVMHLEISRESDPAALARLEHGLLRSLADVRAAVDDWPHMVARMKATVADTGRGRHGLGEAEVSEGLAFLEWLIADRFTFLGARDYDLVTEGETASLRVVPGSGLGILRDDAMESTSSSFAMLPASVRERARRRELLVLTKSNSRATVHRPAYTDYVGIKRFDATGDVIGERRFLGLYTSGAYSASVLDIPVLRRKVGDVMERSGIAALSHKGKALLTILETYPRDEMIQISVNKLLRIAIGILHLDERQQTRLFMRRDTFRRFVACLIFVPRDNYNTEIRGRIQAVLMRALDGRSCESTVSLSESVLARVLLVIHTKHGVMPDYDERRLEADIVREVRGWADALRDALVSHFGEEAGGDLYRKYHGAFPAGYREDCLASVAVHDIELMERLRADDDLGLNLYVPPDAAEGELRFRLLQPERPMPLSDILPVLEHLGVRVIDERPYEIRPAEAPPVWIHDTGLLAVGGDVAIDDVRDLFHDAFRAAWSGACESDALNRLVLGAMLSWRQIAVLRAFTKYARQTDTTFSLPYMEAALVAHPAVARGLVDLFVDRHDPQTPAPTATRGEARTTAIADALDGIPSLDEDRILRRFLAMVGAVTRTNYFQHRPDGAPKPYVSLKFDPALVPGLPEPRPAFEIFVYSPRVEGVHLRGGRVARGGLRWSDRMEDFRTEVLGLMKAQMVKNAVIVPVGAKGGFVVKRPPPGADRDAQLAEGIECYTTFLRGLLDLTGAQVDGSVRPPPDVVRYDDDDTYLVVAADKGTAAFSDIANAVAAEYGFWMGDAFASGGSSGYDHKKMGITARGAWESVKKHFRGLGVDVQTTDFTTVGIGDMSGDVFGNGMLLSPHIRLVAAFDHRHVFLDPDPDAAASHAERRRLFGLPRSSWSDYGADRISRGGGVFPRSAKSIPLSPQVRARLSVDSTALTPHELIRTLLRAPVDLLYNGGVGTYVKAGWERHADVGDRANDGVRVDATELRCRVVAEGGNLGLTQAARVEYALSGGRIYTDAIDNSAGVDCSDHEVNIKILLDAVVAAGRLTVTARNALLADMTDEVAALVLGSNYAQAQALAIDAARATALFDAQTQVIRDLERRGRLSRTVEGLPSDDRLAERRTAGAAFTTAEHAVLLAHAKLALFEQLVDSTLPEDPFVASAITEYFPMVLSQRYGDAIARHPLRREIVATHVGNGLVNRMGSTFVFRLTERTGASAADVVRAYITASAVFDLDTVWTRVSALDGAVADTVQTSMLTRLVRLMLRATLWFIRHPAPAGDLKSAIAPFAGAVATVVDALEGVLGARDLERLGSVVEEYTTAGVPRDLARHVSALEPAYAALDICEASAASGRTLACVAAVYFQLAARLDATWIWDSISRLPTDSHWQAQARAALRDDLEERMRLLTLAVLAHAPESVSPAGLMTAWEEARATTLARTRHVLGEMQAVRQPDLAMLSVSLRELQALA